MCPAGLLQICMPESSAIGVDHMKGRENDHVLITLIGHQEGRCPNSRGEQLVILVWISPFDTFDEARQGLRTVQ